VILKKMMKKMEEKNTINETKMENKRSEDKDILGGGGGG
jgi:hypothetical protein